MANISSIKKGNLESLNSSYTCRNQDIQRVTGKQGRSTTIPHHHIGYSEHGSTSREEFQSSLLSRRSFNFRNQSIISRIRDYTKRCMHMTWGERQIPEREYIEATKQLISKPLATEDIRIDIWKGRGRLVEVGDVSAPLVHIPQDQPMGNKYYRTLPMPQSERELSLPTPMKPAFAREPIDNDKIGAIFQAYDEQDPELTNYDTDSGSNYSDSHENNYITENNWSGNFKCNRITRFEDLI